MLFTLLFIAGLLIGSFLNVIALRYEPGKPMLSGRTLGGRSRCRGCAVTLRWYELVPLFSFIVQGARCRHCSHALAWQYPLVEFSTALLTACLPIFFFSHFNIQAALVAGESLIWFYLFTAIWLLASYTAITLAAIDLRLKILPDQGNLLLCSLGIVLLIFKYLHGELVTYNGSFFESYAAVFWFSGELLLGTLAAVLTALILFGGIIWLSRGRGMGLGDLKLAIPIALLLGWPDAILAFVAAFIIGALFGLMLLAYKVKQMREAIPFGPFLVIGMFVPIFYGAEIVRWYFSLL